MERLDYFIKQGYIYNKITPCKQQEESTSVRGCFFLGIVSLSLKDCSSYLLGRGKLEAIQH